VTTASRRRVGVASSAGSATSTPSVGSSDTSDGERKRFSKPNPESNTVDDDPTTVVGTPTSPAVAAIEDVPTRSYRVSPAMQFVPGNTRS
jgi:hypothetical protein